MFIAAIFWIGGRFGENHKFKDMFPVLSYCLIPVAFHAAAYLGMQLLVPPGYMHGGVYLGGGSLDPDPSLSPSYGLDFAGSLGIFSNSKCIYGIFYDMGLRAVRKGNEGITRV